MWFVTFIGALVVTIFVETIMLIGYVNVNHQLDQSLQDLKPRVEELKQSQNEQIDKIERILNNKCGSSTPAAATTTDAEKTEQK